MPVHYKPRQDLLTEIGRTISMNFVQCWKSRSYQTNCFEYPKRTMELGPAELTQVGGYGQLGLLETGLEKTLRIQKIRFLRCFLDSNALKVLVKLC